MRPTCWPIDHARRKPTIASRLLSSVSGVTAVGLPSIRLTSSGVMRRSATPLASSAVKSEIAPTYASMSPFSNVSAIVAPAVPTVIVSTSPSFIPAAMSCIFSDALSSSEARPTVLPASSSKLWIALSSGTTVPAVFACCGLNTACSVPPSAVEMMSSSMSAIAMSASPFSRNAVLGISSDAGASSALTFSCSKNPSVSATIGA